MAELGRKTPEEVLEEIRRSEKQKVKVAITDIDGVLRGKFISKNKFLSAAGSGFGFCSVVFGWDSFDVCYDNADYTGWHTGYPDTQVTIDLNTYRNIPWDDNTPFFLAEFVNDDGSPLEICPRQLLKKVLKRAQDSGLAPSAGFEYEWFNFKETPQSVNDKNFHNMEALTPGMFGYSVLRSSLNKEFFSALMDEMTAFDVPIEGLHTETGPGVLEAAIQYGEPLEAADRAVLFKTGAKEIAYRFGILPTFMARWNANLPGCGGHVHQSIWDLNGTSNLFFDSENRYKMSKTFEHYLAGQLYCLPELLPFYAPTVNSYKRLTEGFWAPTKPTWGIDNRTSAFRVIPGSSKSTRIEVRVPGADANPYLVLADPELTTGLPAPVTAATGMDAITHLIEAYLAKGFHPICDGIALEGLKLGSANLALCVREPENLEARSAMLMASMMGAIAFQKGLGLTHSCAHALSTVADLHHGLANGIMVDYALKHNLEGVPERFEALAAAVGLKEQTGNAFLEWLKALKKEIGIPAKLSEVKVSQEHLDRLVEVAVADACHQCNPVECSAEDFRRIFSEAL